MVTNKVARAMDITSLQQGNQLTNSAKALAQRQVIADMTRLNGPDSVSTVNAGKVICNLPIPKKFTVTITAGEDAAPDIRIFNNSDFEAVPDGVTVTYSDGFSGKLINKLINNLPGGLFIYGFNVTGYDAEEIKSDEVINSLSLSALYYTGVGTASVPGEIELAGEERNDQFKDGLLTVKTQVIFNMISQLKMSLGAGEKVQFVFSTVPLK